MLSTNVLNKEKEKAAEANNEKDLHFDQGHITKARAISQKNNNSQTTKSFSERKVERRTKILSKVRRRASPLRATLHHLLVRRTWLGPRRMMNTVMFKIPLPPDKTIGRTTSITGIQLMEFGVTTNSGTHHMIRGITM